MYNNLEIKSQEPETVYTLDHALAIKVKGRSQISVLEDAATRPSLLSQKLCAVMREMAKKRAENLYLNQMKESIA